MTSSNSIPRLTAPAFWARLSKRRPSSVVAWHAGESPFPPELLASNPLLRRIVEIVGEGAAVGNADLAFVKSLHPEILDFDGWLARGGAERIRALFT